MPLSFTVELSLRHWIGEGGTLILVIGFYPGAKSKLYIGAFILAAYIYIRIHEVVYWIKNFSFPLYPRTVRGAIRGTPSHISTMSKLRVTTIMIIIRDVIVWKFVVNFPHL